MTAKAVLPPLCVAPPTTIRPSAWTATAEALDDPSATPPCTVPLSGVARVTRSVQTRPPVPNDGSKGTGSIPRWLEMHDLTTDGVKAMLTAVLGWVTRTRRTVEVKVDGDVLVLGNATPQQQERIIEAFIARHRSPA